MGSEEDDPLSGACAQKGGRLSFWKQAITMRPFGARLRGVRQLLNALTIWHPYGCAYVNLRWWRQLLSATLRSAPTKGLSPQKALSLVFTCDLELDPPWQTGSSWEHRGRRGIEEGLPRLLDLLDAQRIHGTFFTEGLLATWPQTRCSR